MKNEYQQNQQFHINIFIKEGIITGIIGLLEYSICWFNVYICVCVLNLWDNVVFYACHCGSQHAR